MKGSYFSPAKINLCLHVVSKRTDGYHNLEMLMQCLDFGDILDIEVTDRAGEVSVDCPDVICPPGSENIAARAARRMLSLSGNRSGVQIKITKRIPVAAGLGGGSSNAATTLLALNRLLQIHLTNTELRAEGVKLGADVPFFLFDNQAWATGIGDQLERIPPLPDVWYVLVNPGIEISTAWVYQNLGLTESRILTKLPRFLGTIDNIVELLDNDLERVTIKKYPLLAEIKEELLRLGAKGSLMSGSGATIFGVYAGETEAHHAAEVLHKETGWRVIAARSLRSTARFQ